MLGGYYPDELGFVASVAHPSRNITGLARSFDRAFFGKTLQILKEAVP